MANWKIDCLNSDELSLLSEEEIADRLGKCRSEMGKRVGDIVWRTEWETQLCYAQRELQIRQTRRRAHADYLAREAAFESANRLYEETLPEYEGNRVPRYVREALAWN